MERQTLEMILPRPVNDPLEQERCDTSAAPFGLGEHIKNDPMSPIGDVDCFACMRKRMRQYPVKLKTCPTNNNFWIILQAGQPADVLAAREGIMKTISRFTAKLFKKVRWHFTHILEHAGAMPSDRVRIGGGG